MIERPHDTQKMIRENIAELEQIIQSEEWVTARQEQQKICEEWLNKVFTRIKTGHYNIAEKIFYEKYLQDRNIYMNTYSAILDFMFKVHKQETENGQDSIFRLIFSLEQMANMYFELKFLVRRFEFDLPDELKEELYTFLQKYPISANAIYEMVDMYVNSKDKVLNMIALFLFERKFYKHAFLLLASAIEKNQDNADTIYNMAYVLYAFGESSMAIQLLDGLKEPSKSILQLKQIIVRGGKVPHINREKVLEEKPLPKIGIPNKPEIIAFIICVNNDRQYKEACYYIHNLLIPEGYMVEIVPVYGAKSMAAGYQEAMKKTSAKYKIYMHQDVLCINKKLLYELLYIFESNPLIGMVGVAGCVKMPEEGIWWEASQGRYLNLYRDRIFCYLDNSKKEREDYNCGEYQEVQVLDGVFLATSKDVDWRRDLFDGWHHYDVSQSIEFQRNGYKVIIPNLKDLWILHNEKCWNILEKDYYISIKRFLQEYMEDLK